MGGAAGVSISGGFRQADGKIREGGGCRRGMQLADSDLRDCEAEQDSNLLVNLRF
ncbi:hypothetical protein KSP39_PZI018155 [Platanthera zijinensis]|uniref:Uncharacterized protein n=1 Tax=Platanthera zijinensis TaxID=2320716 RepID=A0AAP0B2V8_9ASPA